MSWVAAADYRRGAKTAGPGRPCRAYGRVMRLGPDLIAGAVADCADDAPLSHHNAKIAVRTALAAVADRAEAVPESVSNTWRQSSDALFRSVLACTNEEIRRVATEQGLPARDLDTSLVVFAVTHQGTIAARVGNGVAVTRSKDNAYIPLFDPGNEDRTSGTLNDGPAFAQAELEIAHASGPVSFVCAATDALRGLTSRRMGRTSNRRLLRRLDRCATAAPTDTEVHHEIRSFLRSAHVAPRIKEDLGVALCSYRPQGDLFGDAQDKRSF